METKTIAILAKSHKLNAYCFAGQEVIETAGSYSAGDWVRPVSPDGSISKRDCIFKDGQEVNLLDIVEIPIVKHQPNIAQPENYLIDTKQYWGKIGSVQPSDLPSFEESPDSLWLREPLHSDYVSTQSIVDQPPKQSLYFIQPTRLHLNLYHWGKNRLQAIFEYNNYTYALQVTDTSVWDVIRTKYPGRWEEDKAVILEPRDYYLCVSLAGEWQDKHYKLVAALINKTGEPVQ